MHLSDGGIVVVVSDGGVVIFCEGLGKLGQLIDLGKEHS